MKGGDGSLTAPSRPVKHVNCAPPSARQRIEFDEGAVPGVVQYAISRRVRDALVEVAAAGIEIAWVDCSSAADVENEACRRVPGTNDFVLHIVAEGRTSSDLVFGLSFLGEDGAGKYCDIFYDRVEQGHRDFDSDVSTLLGTVAAHELGHLLLGSHGHSYSGIMAPVWKEEILRRMEMGNLLFSSDQAVRMRARIRSAERTLVSVGKNTRVVDF